jgi:hypothetical protein
MPAVTFMPSVPGCGSWEWLGVDLRNHLARWYSTAEGAADASTDCDALIIVKHQLPAKIVAQAANRSAVIYCPVDYYGNAAEIDQDTGTLQRCTRILVHSENLRRYFEPYAPVEYMDHHIKFAAPMRVKYRRSGYLLWVGVRTNLPPLVEWVNAHPLPTELRVLTNPEVPGMMPTVDELGFREPSKVHVFEWTKELHLEMTAKARAAIDIKGTDFRSRHKPPAKAIDFIASGLPLAMNADSNVVDHLGRMGFDVASPGHPERWLSKEYWEETRRFGLALRELLSLERVGRRWKRIIDAVLAEKAGGVRRERGAGDKNQPRMNTDSHG